MFRLLFKDISVAHADEEERTVTECGQGKIQKHKYTSPEGHHSLTTRAVARRSRRIPVENSFFFVYLPTYVLSCAHEICFHRDPPFLFLLRKTGFAQSRFFNYLV